tara:strand:+ start:3465 stop:3665 length:201 start_codon:yes stop_codon:yes gene_type:complete
MELTKKQLEYMLTCLNFHYSESDHKEFYLEINSSIARLVNHELEQIEAYKSKIDRNRAKQPKPEWE